MRTLLVLGFPYPTTADAAAQDVLLQERDLASEPDALAVVSRDDQGDFHITTHHTSSTPGFPFFWQLLLAALIVLPDSAYLEDDNRAAFRPDLGALGLDASFQDRVREMLAPNTSALFLIATEPVPADALTELGRFGGKLLAASLVPRTDTPLLAPTTPARGVPGDLPLPRQE